jgi:hypothetical protein
MDGTLATMKLEEAELGTPLPTQERQAMLRNMYGDLSSGASTLLESPALASLEAASAAAASAAAAAALPPPAAAASAAAALPPPAAAASAAALAASTSPLAPELAPREVVVLQNERRTKEGRRKITPVALDSGAPSMPPTLPKQALVAPAAAAAAAAAAGGAAPSAAAVARPAVVAAAARASAPPSAATVRPAAAAAVAAQPAKRPRASQQGRVPNGHGGGMGACASGDAAEEGGTAAAPPAARGGGALLLLAPAPVPRGTLSAELLECDAQPGAEFRHEFSGHERGVLLLEATPYTAPGARAGGGTLTCSRRAEPIWAAALASPAVLLTGNARFAAAACADGSLHIFTPAGRRALPAVRACAAPAALHADAEHSLLLVGADGTVVVWRHLPHAPECVLRCSAAPLLASGETPLLQASLAADGGPLLHLPTGCFAYHPRMQAWLSPADIHACTHACMHARGWESGVAQPGPTPRTHRTTHCATHMHFGVQAWLNLADTDFVGSAYASSLPLATGAAQAAALARLQQQQAAACRSAAASGDGASVAAARLAMQLGALPPANPNPNPNFNPNPYLNPSPNPNANRNTNPKPNQVRCRRSARGSSPSATSSIRWRARSSSAPRPSTLNGCGSMRSRSRSSTPCAARASCATTCSDRSTPPPRARGRPPRRSRGSPRCSACPSGSCSSTRCCPRSPPTERCSDCSQSTSRPSRRPSDPDSVEHRQRAPAQPPATPRTCRVCMRVSAVRVSRRVDQGSPRLRRSAFRLSLSLSLSLSPN